MFGKQISDQVQLGIDLANLVIFILTLCALILALLQLRRDIKLKRESAQRERERDREIWQREKEISKEEAAKALYRDYLKVSLENPDLSTAQYDENDPISVDKYDTYISIMLSVFEEMLDISEVQEYWIVIVKYHIRVHNKYIRADLHMSVPHSISFRSAYSEKLLNIIDEIFEEIDCNAANAAPIPD